MSVLLQAARRAEQRPAEGDGRAPASSGAGVSAETGAAATLVGGTPGGGAAAPGWGFTAWRHRRWRRRAWRGGLLLLLIAGSAYGAHVADAVTRSPGTPPL
ncbi:MAG: hypothetical protein RID91_18240, partial [Azospirillaceae bacterium]